MIKVALLTTDSREHFKDYANPNPYFGTAPEALIEGFKLLPDQVEIHIVSCLQKAPVSSPAKLAENIHYHALHVPNIGWMKTGYQGCIRAVRRKLREIRPDIVHGQGTERDCAVSAVLSRYPNVVTIHGNMSRIAEQTQARPPSYYWFAAQLEKWCVRRTDGIVAISSHTKGLVASYANRVWLVHNAVNSDFFKTTRHETREKRLLCVAHVSPWKNQIGLIKALDLLRCDIDFELHFVGKTGGQDCYSKEFLRMVNERDWITYKGTLNRHGLMREFASAAAVILPSLEDNCPMVLLEAAAAGMPILAAAIGGIPDLVEDGQTGTLFDPHSPTAIGRAVRAVLSDEVNSATMARRAKEKCLSKHSPEIVARRHLLIYREVIDSFNPLDWRCKDRTGIPQTSH